jgi:hypothetical protein
MPYGALLSTSSIVKAPAGRARGGTLNSTHCFGGKRGGTFNSSHVFGGKRGGTFNSTHVFGGKRGGTLNSSHVFGGKMMTMTRVTNIAVCVPCPVRTVPSGRVPSAECRQLTN